jgi:tetratricopeptide (TPR) repeat protein
MAHWQQGEKEQARKWYAAALVWAEKWNPRSDELRRFRAEAASLLGLPEKLSPEQDQARADEVKLYTLVLEANPEAAWAYLQRGGAFAELAQWDKASADFAKAIELRGDDPQPRYRLALVRLQQGDRDEYRKVCAGMLERIGPKTDTDLGYWVVWTCVLGPDAVSDWKPVVDLAEKSLAADPKSYDRLQNLGAVLYRAGRFEEAARRLAEAEATFAEVRNPRSTITYAWLFLAMTERRRGQAEEAKKWLDRAVEAIDQPPEKSKDVGAGAWNRRLTLHLLQREAQARPGKD